MPVVKKIAAAAAMVTVFALSPDSIGASPDAAANEKICATERLFASATTDAVNGLWRRSIKTLQLLAASPVEDCEADHLRLHAAILHGDLLWKRGDVSGGKKLLAKAREQASAIGFEDLAVEAQIIIAEIAYVQAHIMRAISSDEALKAHKLALKEAKQIGRADLVARALGRIGVIFERRGDYAKAEGFYRDALALAEKHDAKAMLHLPLTHLGSINTRTGNMGAAWRYYARAMEAAEQSPAPEHLVFALINNARHNQRTAQYTVKDALIDVYRAHEIARRLEHQIAICLSYLALGARHLEIGENEIAKSNIESARLVAAENEFSVLQDLALSLIEANELDPL